MSVTHGIKLVRLPPLPTIRDLVGLYKLRAIKQLSQNFLMDERLTDKIVKTAGRLEGQYVCEVGPGPGGITRSVIRKGPKQLVVVEKDPRFMPTLELLAEACRDNTKMDIVLGDILKFNFESSFPDAVKHDWFDRPPPITLLGNLPFSVSTILVIRWLESISERKGAWSYGRSTMTLTFQKEVAERMAAPILSKQRCRLSIMCQIYCNVNHRFTIPGAAFVPKPDVDVGVVKLTPLKQPLTDLPFKLVERVVRHIFSMRQKYSRRGLSTLYPEELREELTDQTYDLADIDPTIRPFQLSTEEFCRLCSAYNELSIRHPEILLYDYRGPKIPVSAEI